MAVFGKGYGYHGRTRSALLIAYVVFSTLPFLASCGAKAPERPKETSRVVFLHYFSGTLSGGIDDLVSAFNKGNPGFDLSAVPLDHESFKSSIGDTLATGNPPDLYSYWAGAKTKAIIDQLEPIDDVWAEAGLDRVFPPALAASASSYEGKRYLVPLTQHAVGFFYNKKLFEKAGIGVPSDWESFKGACAALKAAGITPIALGADSKWPAQFWFDYLLLRTAGPEYRERLMAGKAAWTDGEVRQAFSLWRDLLVAGYFNGTPESTKWDTGAARMVAEDQAAMTLMGTWILGVWNGFGLDWKEERDYGFFPFPTVSPGVPSCVVGPVDGVVVPKRALNSAGAKRVLGFLAGATAQEAMSRGSGALAPNGTVPSSAYSAIQLRVREVIAESQAWAFNYDLATPPAASEIGLSLFADFLRFSDRYEELLKAAQARFEAVAGRDGA